MASTKKYAIDANVRKEIGKGASRRLRRNKQIPGIMYGGGKPPVSLTFEHRHVIKALEDEAFYSRIISLTCNSETDRVILKDMQRHAFKPQIMHLDFQRIRSDEKLTMNIPLNFMGSEKTPGVKVSGGIISYLETDIEISCFPDDLPESIVVDISGLELNQILHISDLSMPKGVESVALLHEDDKPIVSVHIPRVEEEVPSEAPVASEVPAISQKAEGEESKESGNNK